MMAVLFVLLVAGARLAFSTASVSTLAAYLNVSSPSTVAALQSAVQSYPGSDATSKALLACALSGIVFNQQTSSSKVPEFLNPASAEYITRTEVQWSSNCFQNASCIVSPASRQDVAKAMQIITFAQTTFSIRSGGHDFNVNHSSVDRNGLLVDLVNLNSIQLSSDKRTVTVGAGNIWGNVHSFLNGSGVTVNGARSPNPGVGGQTLGGGLGWFGGLAGVTAASLVAAEVVLANSQIVRATEQNNSDLLWALRGGGPNYGIVTSFTYKTLPIDKIWFAGYLYTADQNQQLIDAIIEYENLAVHDPNATIVVSLSQDASSPGSLVGLTYAAPVTSTPAVFSAFSNITPAFDLIPPTIGTAADLTWRYSSPQFPDAGVPEQRHYVVSLAHTIDNATYRDAWATFVSYAAQAQAKGWSMNYGSQHTPPSMIKASSNTPLNLAAVNQDWPHAIITWTSPSDDAAAEAMIRSIGQDLVAATYKHQSSLPYKFMNDAYDGQDVLRGYGTVNFQKLTSIARKYDPSGVFQRLQHGGWLLSRE